jgi:small-conductance mechanosensitive channel
MVSPVAKTVTAVFATILYALFVMTLAASGFIPTSWLSVVYSTFAIFIGATIYYFLTTLTLRIREERLRFTFDRLSIAIAIAVSIIIILFINIQEVTYLALSLGLVAAGVSFSLQGPITSLVGWLVLALERPFAVGDRIEINNVAGDVVDYGFFFIKVMEVHAWTDADLYTGRILLVPTNWILSNAVYNYSKDFDYIWDKIWIGLLYGSDFAKISSGIKEIANSFTAQIREQAETAYRKFRKKYYVQDATLEPQVFVSFDSNWVQIDLRYISPVRARSKTRSELSSLILQYLENNKITVASSSMNVNLTGKSNMSQT